MNKHIGSSLESLFDEAGEREEFEARVMKKMIVDEIRESMERRKITPPHLATQMRTSRAAIKRLLDPCHTGLTLDTLVRAAAVLGLSLSLKRKSARPAKHRARSRSAKKVSVSPKARASSRTYRRLSP